MYRYNQEKHIINFRHQNHIFLQPQHTNIIAKYNQSL